MRKRERENDRRTERKIENDREREIEINIISAPQMDKIVRVIFKKQNIAVLLIFTYNFKFIV